MIHRLKATLDSLSLKTPWPAGRIPAYTFLVVSAIGAVWLLIPRASSWPLTHIFAEDGQVFLTQTLQGGWSTIMDTYAGYLHVVPRMISNTCAEFGPSSYLVCTSSFTIAIKIAGFAIAFPVLAAYARSWKWGMLAASVFLFIPAGQQEVLGNITNLRWFLVAIVFFAVVGASTSKKMIIFVSVLVLLAALSDPLTFAFAPIAIWRITTLRTSRMSIPSVVLLIGIVIHTLSLQPGARGERGTIVDLLDTPTQTIAQLLVRGPLVSQIGMTGTQDLLRLVGVPLAVALLAVPVVLTAVAWRSRPLGSVAFSFSVLLVTVGLALLFITLSFPASYIALADIWSPSQPARYSVLAGLFITPALILLMSLAWRSQQHKKAGQALALVSTLLLATGLLMDFGGDARHAAGASWESYLTEAKTQCELTGEDPTFTTTPEYEGWQTTIRCSWLG